MSVSLKAKRFLNLALPISCALVASSLGCSDIPTNDDVAKDVAAIEGGQSEDGFPAVGRLNGSGSLTCTGTLVAPSVVLSAWHCRNDAKTFRTTGAQGVLQNLRNVDAKIGHPLLDVMLVHLDAPITDVSPMAYSGAAPAVGSTCNAVGYGKFTDPVAGSFGLKRSATEIVTSVLANAIWVKKGTGIVAKGDSGGPLLCSGLIRGALSAGGSSTARYTRPTDGWVADNMQVSPPPPYNSLYIAQASAGVYRADRRSGNYVLASNQISTNTVNAIAPLGTSIYLILDGQLHQMLIADGSDRAIGAVDFPNATDMVSVGGFLYVLQGAGIWKVTDLSTGVPARVGTKNWTGATSMTAANGKLYVIHAGALYGVDQATGVEATVSAAGWAGPTRMVGSGPNLYVVQDNRLWRVKNLTTGATEMVDDTDWSNTTAMTTMGSLLYLVQEGYLFKVDPTAHTIKALGPLAWGGQVVMTPSRCGEACNEICTAECSGLSGTAGVMCVNDCDSNCAATECS